MATGVLGKPTVQVVSGIFRYKPQEYTLTHNATTDWTSINAGDLYQITVLASAHGLGTSPLISCFLDTGSGLVLVLPDSINVAVNGDVSINVSNAGVDGRYAGRIQIARS